MRELSNPGDAPTSSTLLEQVRGGNDEAWNYLVEFYAPLVYERCRRSGYTPADAADITQDVFLAVSQNIHRFRKDRPGDRFRNWLQTIISSKIRDFARRRKTRPSVAAGGSVAQKQFAEITDPDSADFEDSIVGEWKPQIVKRALDLMRSDFNETTWQAFWMSAVDGKTATEVGEILGISKGAVRQAKSRVRKRLADELGEFVRFEARDRHS